MPDNAPVGQFSPDSRGNRLEHWDVVPNRADCGHMLWLRGPFEVVRQVGSVADYACLPVDVVAGTAFTHALSSREPFQTETARLLDLLCSHLSLPNPPAVHTAISLDWYKIPNDKVPSDQWMRTSVGELVKRGKYSKQHVEQRAVVEAGRRLTDLLFDAVREHRLLNAPELILDVPGHDSKVVSFGSRLADAMARKLGVEFVRVSTRRSFRPAVKNIAPDRRREILRDEFYVARDLSGKSLLIVDDIFQTGASMGAVAEAARRVGARLINGITAARTLKR